MLSVAIVLEDKRRPIFRFFGSDSYFGKQLSGYAAKPLKHAHTVYLHHGAVLL